MRRCGLGVRLAKAIESAPNQRSVNRYRRCTPVWPGQAPDAAWGKRPMRPGHAPDAAWGKRPMRPGHAPDAAWGKRPMRPGKCPMRPRQAHCKQLGMCPVTLRRISQHPPVTSKLGLTSRLALPAHFHRQPVGLMCELSTRRQNTVGRGVNTHRAPALQTFGFGRASSTFKQRCLNFKTVQVAVK